MQPLLRQIHSLLLKKGLTVAVAESCTGGSLSKLLTDTPDSSKYFLLGVVAYSNFSKEKILKISSSLIKTKGAVSEETAKLLAKNVRRISGADIGIAITGIAGPQGGTLRKPVGTVFIALDSEKKKIFRKLNFKGNRVKIRQQAALKALGLLKQLSKL